MLGISRLQHRILQYFFTLCIFVPPRLFTSPRLRSFGHNGREVNRRHVRLSCARDWCHLNHGTKPGSFVQRQAGDTFDDGAAVLAVVFINNKVTSSAAVPQPQVSVSVSTSPSHRVSFACLNVRSLNNKLEDVLEIIRDRRSASPSRGTTQTVSALAICDQLVSVSSTDRVHVLQMICWSTTAASLFSSRRRISP